MFVLRQYQAQSFSFTFVRSHLSARVCMFWVWSIPLFLLMLSRHFMICMWISPIDDIYWCLYISENLPSSLHKSYNYNILEFTWYQRIECRKLCCMGNLAGICPSSKAENMVRWRKFANSSNYISSCDQYWTANSTTVGWIRASISPNIRSSVIFTEMIMNLV